MPGNTKYVKSDRLEKPVAVAREQHIVRSHNVSKNWRRAGAFVCLLGLAACSWGEETVEEPQPLPAEASYPDINTVPTERPEPIIVDIFAAPQGLKADTGNADHVGELTGGPTSTAEPPPPPPPPPEPVVDPTVESSDETAPAPGTEPDVGPEATPEDAQQSFLGDPGGNASLVHS